MQNSASFIKRLKWMIKDREEYKTSVKKITESNDLVEGLVRARTMYLFKSKSLSEADRESKSSMTVHNESRKSYANGAVYIAYRRSVLYRYFSSTSPYLFSVQSGRFNKKSQFGLKISLKHPLTRETVLEQFEKLPLRLGSQVYMLQAQKPPGVNESTFLIAESPIGVTSAQPTPQVSEEDLDPFTYVGDFRTLSCNVHRLYKDSTSWASVMSLQELIASTEKPPSASTRFRLAGLLAATYLHFSGLMYLPGQLNPESFKCFDFTSEAQTIAREDLLEDEDRLLNLYHFFGIGRTHPNDSQCLSVL